MLREKGINSNGITVNTYKGQVQLSGFVSSPEQIERATTVDRKVASVVEVENALRVK